MVGKEDDQINAVPSQQLKSFKTQMQSVRIEERHGKTPLRNPIDDLLHRLVGVAVNAIHVRACLNAFEAHCERFVISIVQLARMNVVEPVA